ncbi:Hpt domain-containing protein, partial [Patescibacteria group bacterium]|nr:Hpt domain-containing protein [Patescibacteria group bacterium]
MKFDLASFKEDFLTEEQDNLQALDGGLLKLEKKPADKEILNELMRFSHTVKGAAGMMGFKKMAFLAHVIEDVFDYARNNLLEITPKTIEILFEGLDGLNGSLEQIRKTDKEKNLDSLSKKIKAVTGVETQGIGKSKRSEGGEPEVAKQKLNVKKEVAKKVVGGKASLKETKAKQKEIADKIKLFSYIKVPVKRLDTMMDLLESLLI